MRLPGNFRTPAQTHTDQLILALTADENCTVSKTVKGRIEPVPGNNTAVSPMPSNTQSKSASFISVAVNHQQALLADSKTSRKAQVLLSNNESRPSSCEERPLEDIEEEDSTSSEEDRKLPGLPPPLSKNKSSESFSKMSISTPSGSNPASGNNGDASGKQNPKKPNKNSPKEGQSSGRWTEEEHQAFLRGLHTYGREWKKVASHIPTRTSAQVRSHAQKYFAKLQKEEDSWGSGGEGAAAFSSANAGAAAASHEGDYAGRLFGMETPAQTSTAAHQNVTRILANPEGLEQEVENTLQQLRERYQQLQRRLEQTGSSSAEGRNRKRRSANPVVAPDDHSSTTSLTASLQNEELIALSVLRGALSRGDASTGASELSEENMEVESQKTDESTDSVSKKPKRE